MTLAELEAEAARARSDGARAWLVSLARRAFAAGMEQEYRDAVERRQRARRYASIIPDEGAGI